MLITLTFLRMYGLAFVLALAGDGHVLLPYFLTCLLCTFTLVSDIGGPADDIQRNVPICVLLANTHMAILEVHRILTDTDLPLVVQGE